MYVRTILYKFFEIPVIVDRVSAKVIKYWFDANTIDYLEKSKWYDLEPDQIMDYYQLADEPLVFAQRIIEDFNRNE